MPQSSLDNRAPLRAATKEVLELVVRNHPGVMVHVCGLFARRAYNVEAIYCMPIGDGQTSRILLLVKEDDRLDQMIKQVTKLEDVLRVDRRTDADAVFGRLQSVSL